MGDKIGITTLPFLLDLEQEDNTRTGATSRATWQCVTEAQAEAQKLYAQALGGSEVSIKAMGNGFWACSASFPFGFDGLVTDYGAPLSVHELQVVTAQVNVYRSSKLRTLLTAEQIGFVARTVEEYNTGKFSATAGDTSDQIAAALAAIDALIAVGAARTNAHALFGQVTQLGLEDFIEYRTVYQRTLTAATPALVSASFTGSGMIWTTAEVMAYEGIPAGGWFVLPPEMLWLKSRPTVLAASGQKTQVVYSYTECMAASGLVYDAYGSATLL